MTLITRRTLIALGLSGIALPQTALAGPPRKISWEDLIPADVPYAQIVGEGFLDEVNDVWRPIYDSNARKMNEALDGVNIRMPGFVTPLELTLMGVTTFILVPSLGACIHTPPPPTNQMILVTTDTPWPNKYLWEPIWVTGTLQIDIQTTSLAETGYIMAADTIEVYEW